MISQRKNHRQLRESYLEGLAEAIVLHQSPTLHRAEAIYIREEQKTKQLKNLIKREKYRRMYRKIGHTLAPNLSKGLNRVDIPDKNAKGENLGRHDDPKAWKGPWVSITRPEEIAKHVSDMNIKQYNRAYATPFGSGPLAEVIGRNGDTPATAELLDGTLPTTILADLMPETIRLLQTLATPKLKMEVKIKVEITEEEFISTFRVVREDTSSSPTGHHVGHYKAILKDPALVQVHTTMMSIPFQAGFAPQRWTNPSH